MIAAYFMFRIILITDTFLSLFLREVPFIYGHSIVIKGLLPKYIHVFSKIDFIESTSNLLT